MMWCDYDTKQCASKSTPVLHHNSNMPTFFIELLSVTDFRVFTLTSKHSMHIKYENMKQTTESLEKWAKL